MAGIPRVLGRGEKLQCLLRIERMGALSLSPNSSLSSQFSRTLLSLAGRGRGREPRMPVGIWNGAQLKEQFENIFSPYGTTSFCNLGWSSGTNHGTLLIS